MVGEENKEWMGVVQPFQTGVQSELELVWRFSMKTLQKLKLFFVQLDFKLILTILFLGYPISSESEKFYRNRSAVLYQ